MGRGKCISLAVLVGAIGLALLFLFYGKEAPRRNLIIVSLDTASYSSLRAFNAEAPELPWLDRLAGSSVRLTRALSTASWTLPAHGSLFTGLYPDQHGAVRLHQGIHESLPLLAEEFRRNGFVTAGFTDGSWLSNNYGFNRGFNLYDDWVNPEEPWPVPPLPRGGKRNRTLGMSLFDRGISFLKSWKGGEGERFFLFLHTYIVHNYFYVHPWSVGNLDPLTLKDRDYYLECLLGEKDCSDEDWSHLKKLYQAEMKHVDEGIGRLVTALQEKGLWDATTIVILSDHGEGLDPVRDRIHHAGRLHEDLIRIPLFIRDPGLSPGEIDSQVSLVDVMPTLLDLFGLPVPEGLDGRSFAGTLGGKDDGEPRELYAMEHSFRWEDGRRVELPEAAATSSALSVIRGSEWYIRAAGGEELYDMDVDPSQRDNLISRSSGLDELRKLADGRMLSRRTAPVVRMSDGLEDQLKSLGYIK